MYVEVFPNNMTCQRHDTKFFLINIIFMDTEIVSLLMFSFHLNMNICSILKGKSFKMLIYIYLRYRLIH